VIARAATALAVLAGLAGAACSGGDTICERTGRCVALAGGGVPIQGAPALEPAAMFGAPVGAPAAISSTFGPRWKASASRDDFHLGIDYHGALGEPLLAIGEGRVAGVYPDGSAAYPSGGNVIVVEHALPPRTFHGQAVDRMFAVYLHADTIGVAADQAVTRGQRIGAMGKTGDTDFVHLHFETRVQTVCSLGYQQAHPECAVGFDPHVHPYLFVGGANTDQITVEELPAEAEGGFAARYTATRGDLDLDVIETDLGALGFGARTGIDATSIATLDDLDYGHLRLVPLPFLSTSEALAFELHFARRPAFLELRDIHGRGLRFGERPD
jgi:murein DD-endopeptidase MepM/ murein hydrolase activator NlpD